jgi:hypothetical protein
MHSSLLQTVTSLCEQVDTVKRDGEDVTAVAGGGCVVVSLAPEYYCDLLRHFGDKKVHQGWGSLR